MQTSYSPSLLLVESTSFVNDTKWNYGSCLYFYNKGQCVQNGVCSTSCYIIGGYGHHSNVEVTNTQNSSNYVCMTSISQCGKEVNGDGCLYHVYGEFLSSNVNISKSICDTCSAIYFLSGLSSAAKFCSFGNTTASSFCISLSTSLFESTGPSKLSFSNVIGNTAVRCIYCGFDQLRVEECVIKENEGKYLFSNSGIEGWIDVIHCIVSDNDYGGYFSEGVVKTDNIETDKVDIIFAHISTEVCKIDFGEKSQTDQNFDEKSQTDQVNYFILSCFYECIFLPISLNSS